MNLWQAILAWLNFLVHPAPPPVPVPVSPPPTPGAITASEFLAWLNQLRISRSRLTVQYSAALEAVSVKNNSMMVKLGFGHQYHPNVYQCIAAGAPGPDMPGPFWLSDPGHAAVLLQPTITAIGFALCPSGNAYGTYWTLSAR